MHLIKATMADMPRLMAFYAHVTEHTPRMAETAKWIFGMHPCEADVAAYVQKGGLYFAEENGTILGAFAMGNGDVEPYHDIPWESDLPDDQVAVLHMLGVNPDFQGRGYGHALVLSAAELARSLGMRSLRLDTFVCNTPGQRAYDAAGMHRAAIRPLYTPNAGWTDSYFYELLL